MESFFLFSSVIFFIVSFILLGIVKNEKKNLILEQNQQKYIIEVERKKLDKELLIKRQSLEKEISEQKKTLYTEHLEKQKAAQELIAAEWEDLNNKEGNLAEREQILGFTKSNLTAIPYMASIVADFDTRGLEILAKQLDWGRSYERAKKVTSIRELRRQTKELLEESKAAQYQLAYAIKMFPALEDFLETDYNQLPSVDFSNLTEENHDAVRIYLSNEEYAQLSPVQRNQLALDRYRNSHRKTNWQIGRDYEHYVGYAYTQKGYTVDYYGSLHGLEDLGRDLIAAKPNCPTLVIQCKYWSTKKVIHEKHINQLYGTMVCYCFENGLPHDQVLGVLVTNISISETARKFAQFLGIEVVENFPLKEYPCIKCNINYDEFGNKTKIYHLPFDQQYDSCKIDKSGEFFAMTVAEAEAAGFRRAFRWYGNE